MTVPEPHHSPAPEDPAPPRRSGLRMTLWIVLVVSLLVNGTTSLLGMTVLLSAAFGLVAIGCVVALVRLHLRERAG